MMRRLLSPMVAIALFVTACAADPGTATSRSANDTTGASSTTIGETDSTAESPQPSSTSVDVGLAPDFITWDDPAYLDLVGANAVAVDVTLLIEGQESMTDEWTDIWQSDAFQRSFYDPGEDRVRTLVAFGDSRYEKMPDGWKPVYEFPESATVYNLVSGNVSDAELVAATSADETWRVVWRTPVATTESLEWTEDTNGAVWAYARRDGARPASTTLEYRVRVLDEPPLVEPAATEIPAQYAEAGEFDFLFAVTKSFYRWAEARDSVNMDLADANDRAANEDVGVKSRRSRRLRTRYRRLRQHG